MKTLAYLYWRFLKGNSDVDATSQKLIALIQIFALFMVNMMALLFIFDSLFSTNAHDFGGWLHNTDSTLIRRGKIALVFFPFFLILFFFFKINSKRINALMESLNSMSENEKKQKNKNFWIGIISTVIFLLLGITSGGPYGWVTFLRNSF